MEKNNKSVSRFFDRFSTVVTDVAGSPAAFMIALLIIIVWAVTGPIFHFSDTWQLVINTGTTIITFLMVFVIQQTQNKDTMALQLKLNELIAANKNASNRLIDVEDLTEEELKILKAFYVKLSDKAKKAKNLQATHSIEEADAIDLKKAEASRNEREKEVKMKAKEEKKAEEKKKE
jgi:low affinity Fe/Cu permease